jgi:hypothetical protein
LAINSLVINGIEELIRVQVAENKPLDMKKGWGGEGVPLSK